MEESMWRDPHISPNRAQTEQSAQMEKTLLMTRLESLQQRANLMKIKLAPQNLNHHQHVIDHYQDKILRMSYW